MEAQKEYRCVVCSKVCSSAPSLSRHKKVHSDFIKKKCSVCKKDILCTRQDNYKKHVSRCAKKMENKNSDYNDFECIKFN